MLMQIVFVHNACNQISPLSFRPIWPTVNAANVLFKSDILILILFLQIKWDKRNSLHSEKTKRNLIGICQFSFSQQTIQFYEVFQISASDFLIYLKENEIIWNKSATFSRGDRFWDSMSSKPFWEKRPLDLFPLNKITLHKPTERLLCVLALSKPLLKFSTKILVFHMVAQKIWTGQFTEMSHSY